MTTTPDPYAPLVRHALALLDEHDHLVERSNWIYDAHRAHFPDTPEGDQLAGASRPAGWSDLLTVIGAMGGLDQPNGDAVDAELDAVRARYTSAEAEARRIEALEDEVAGLRSVLRIVRGAASSALTPDDTASEAG